MKIARQFKFESSHILPYHDGKCRFLHGHSYRLELVLSGTLHPPRESDPQSGFIVDFGLLDQLVQKELVDRFLDHVHLNESLPALPYPSAEYLAAWIFAWCVRHLEPAPELNGARVERVRLWETVNAWAEADRDDAMALIGLDEP